MSTATNKRAGIRVDPHFGGPVFAGPVFDGPVFDGPSGMSSSSGRVLEAGPGATRVAGRYAADVRPRHEGHGRLTELITNKYALDEINDGYQDLMDGKHIRGVVVHQR